MLDFDKLRRNVTRKSARSSHGNRSDRTRATIRRITSTSRNKQCVFKPAANKHDEPNSNISSDQLSRKTQGNFTSAKDRKLTRNENPSLTSKSRAAQCLPHILIRRLHFSEPIAPSLPRMEVHSGRRRLPRPRRSEQRQSLRGSSSIEFGPAGEIEPRRSKTKRSSNGERALRTDMAEAAWRGKLGGNEKLRKGKERRARN